jgi:hypothetical protein
MINFNVNYNKKIIHQLLNPNNTNYQNPNIDYSGNPDLQPTIYNNYEAKLVHLRFFIASTILVRLEQVINK